ncbi:SGNH/GDSL hydrolase family protein [Candidatus Kaiserbacteria bacterium]|nr:SGNH/GDSL hydrolase family protein [Candidatus Kaiserbacteria bacterium]
MRIRIRTLAFWIAGIFLSLLVALIAVEIFLRVVLPDTRIPDIEIRMPDAKLGYTIIPGASLGAGYRSDANGFNNDTVPARADIVALGDSFTFGENATTDTTWPADLGRLMHLSVYNMGVGGYGPVQYYALTEKALSFHPKYVIVGLLLGNDFFDAYNMVYNGALLDKSFYDHYRVPYVTDAWKGLRSLDFVNDAAQTPGEFNHEQNIPLNGLRTWLHTHSALYAFLSDRSYILREKPGLAKPHWLGTTDWNQTDPDVTLRYDNGEVSTVFWEGRWKLGVDLTNKNIVEGERLTKELLLAIKAKVEASGATFVIMLIPDKELAYAPLIGEKLEENADFVQNLQNEGALKDMMLGFCADNRIACADPLAALTARLEAGDQLYPKTWDGHPLPPGYQVLANTLGDVLPADARMPRGRAPGMNGAM